ncbi:hypothetical protein DB35_18095 [Streptomyces abyssalis]|uniref:Large membrane protein n=1 Tax=Streptomyces abyssalis TaxID=933944 RepID=A0A1E7JM13_9ACTN|nr:hypothetical protein AN215_19250 [Streptomyces abyssalis]OEU91318.1 hypothetical protein DB35_18095 [Streptomyces abyssalis]
MGAPPGPQGPGGERAVRQRRHRLSVITVATAVLVAGGGGAWWASTAGGERSAGTGSGSASEPPRLALDGLVSAEQSGEDGREGPGIAPGEPHPQVYRANGELPGGPDAAAVYRNPASVERGSVSALAGALGVNGKPEKKAGRWVVGEDEKSPGGTALTVNDDRMAGNWTYRSGDWPAMRCGKPPVSAGLVPPEGGGAPDSCSAMPGSGEGDPISEDKAKSAVRPVLKTLELEGAELDAGVTAGALRMVTATPKVGGMKAQDWNSTFTVNKDGKVVRGHGNLGELRKGASYPVMSAEKTLKHLNKQGSAGSGAGASTVREPWAHDGKAEPGKKTAKPESTEPEPGKVRPRKALKVTGAEFGLVTRYTVGKPVLVPSWIYEVRLDGGHTASVAHPAVEPRYLKPARPAQPGSGGAPGSGSGSGSAPEPGPDSGPGAGSGQAGEPGSPPAQAVNSYEADGRKVKLTFWGGVCSGYEAVAEESGKTVKVTVRQKEKDSKKVCVKMAKLQSVEVELDKALGDREVVDATDGEGLPRK